MTNLTTTTLITSDDDEAEKMILRDDEEKGLETTDNKAKRDERQLATGVNKKHVLRLQSEFNNNNDVVGVVKTSSGSDSPMLKALRTRRIYHHRIGSTPYGYGSNE